MKKSGEWRVPEARSGQRLDRALEEIFPDLGLRGRRRLLEKGAILINSQSAKGATRVKTGDLVKILDQPEKEGPAADNAFLLAVQEPYCFFYKPPGLHTAVIAASLEPSLQALIPDLIPETLRYKEIRLLQRLDYGTSGIVAAALTSQAERAYRQMEKEGLISKHYLALLEGRLEGPVKVAQALDTDNRRKTRVLREIGPKATFFDPVYTWEKDQDKLFSEIVPGKAPVTLAVCRLSSGQRHQIRAHASWLGHPLCGDPLYGNGAGNFILQHFHLAFPEHEIGLKGSTFIKNQLSDEPGNALKAWLDNEKSRIGRSDIYGNKP